MPHVVLQHYYHIKISASIIANLTALWTYEIADSSVSKVFSKLQPLLSFLLCQTENVAQQPILLDKILGSENRW